MNLFQIFWNEEDGCWFDYDLITKKHIKTYMDSSFFPLFTESAHDGQFLQISINAENFGNNNKANLTHILK